MAHVHLTCTTGICTCHYTTDIPCVAHATRTHGRRVGSGSGRRTVYASPTDSFEGTTKGTHSHADMIYRVRVIAMLLRTLCLELSPSNIAMFQCGAQWARAHYITRHPIWHVFSIPVSLVFM